MIITNIIGGLGNQMFQYATARAVSADIDQPLRLDISGFDSYKLHQGFELGRIFNLPIEVASADELISVLGWQSKGWPRRYLKRGPLRILRSKNIVTEPSFGYWEGIRHLSGNRYLEGYWQSEKYFSRHADLIRSDFSFKVPMSPQNADIAKSIAQSRSVSLHVRRGDYVNNLKTNATHGVCTLDYYQRAIEYVVNKVTSPSFYIFSDDIDWVKANLVIDFPVIYVEHNKGSDSFNDMRLMSLCQHHIIANSSFSWWGAWLNPDPEKIVIAPKQWFASNTDISDLLPSSWTSL